MICFNCGQRYTNAVITFKLSEEEIQEHPNLYDALNEGFCSVKCMTEDNARLVEGNGIVETAVAVAKMHESQAFSDLNKLRLDVSGQVGQNLGSLLHFGRKDQNP